MLFIGYLYGIRSERQLFREVQVNIAYRWFLGLDLTEQIPPHHPVIVSFPRYSQLHSEVVILTAVYNIKSNRGSETPGSDGETMREGILEQDYQEVISQVQESLKDYHPAPVRRAHIPKPGKTEKRPLGIITAIDKVVQECVRIVIEPILERLNSLPIPMASGQCGMRPHMALERVVGVAHVTGYNWIIEGDISKFFDNVNHKDVFEARQRLVSDTAQASTLEQNKLR